MITRGRKCGICAGDMTLRYPGSSRAHTADSLSPTSHPLGAHGAIYDCRECGTLQQPALVAREDLEELYGAMRDDAYLQEEQGRRRTARRLLDLIGSHGRGGRLLDVGSGYGLLLDEARAAGYEVTGLELSASAAAYAREILGLDVREQMIEQLDSDEAFDVITLIDALEHLRDPVSTIDRCHALLSPGGLLCIVTPDPSSTIARLAGPRWWALVPAHTYLLPRLTLLELLMARGLAVAEDVPFVRSFSWSYWLAGLAERSRQLGTLLSGASRLLANDGPTLSLSLFDERVVLASKLKVAKPLQPLVRDRARKQKVHIVLPAYNAASTIGSVADVLPTETADRALLVDDASTDETSEVALRSGFDVIRHPTNRGYGANQKTCYVRAALDGADIAVMVHADHQYDPRLVAEMVKPISEGRADVVIGSRLLEDEAIAGGMPRWKWLGNRFLTAIENLAFGRSLSEYHTGYRAYSIEFLRTIPFLRNNDSFVFDQEIFAQIADRDARVEELAIPTRYFLEASSVSFRKSLDYGIRTLEVLLRFRLSALRSSWTLLRRPAVALEAEQSSVSTVDVVNSSMR